MGNIDDLLTLFLKENQLNTYEEYFEKETTAIQKARVSENNTLKIKNNAIDSSNIISAGKAIKNVVYTTSFMITIAVIALIIVSSSRDMETIENTYIFSGALSLICNIIILLQLYSAGDNLENSVYQKKIK